MRWVVREGRLLLGTVLCAVAVGVGLYVFVYRAGFAPGGVDGLTAVLVHLLESRFGLRANAGLITLLLNLPLLLLAWRYLRPRYVAYTLLYTLTLSLTLSLCAVLGLYQYDCLDPALGHNALLAAIFGGAAQGLTGYMLRIGASSGGVDVIGGMLALRYPHRDLERLIAWVSYAVVLLSFLVFGDLGSLCLSVVAVYTCERVSLLFLRPLRGAIRFEVISPPEEGARVREFVTTTLGRGATVLAARGGYDGGARVVTVCLVGYRQAPELLRFCADLPASFLSYADATGVRGRFARGEDSVKK